LAGGYGGYGVFFFWEKQLASLRHLFPCQKNTPYPPTDVQHGNTKGKKQMQLFSDYPPMPVGAGWLLDFLPEKDV
jgi:hypothetical protein